MKTTNVEHLILIVEDSEEDYITTIRAFKKAKLRNPIVRCKDGDETLDYLFRKGRFSDPAHAPLPCIVLLDLNLPGTDGREVLKEMKEDKALRKIPVVVMTTSSDERDIKRCYKYGANSYMLKPVSFDGYIQAIQRLNDYWFEVVLLPGINE